MAVVDFKNKIYRPNEIGQVLNELDLFKKLVKNNRKNLEYYEVPCAFDIETTSFMINERHKYATMYIWQFAICGHIIIGRTWNDFIEMMNVISEKLLLWRGRRLLIYVHNLAFEFSFIRKWFEWVDVFNMETNKPLYAVTSNGLEFRCSYLLSNASLATVADNLVEHEITKLIGDLDYSKIRHSKTPITEQEMAYCVNDVKIVIAYVQEQLNQEGSIFRLPYTNTGRVRTYVREACDNKKFKNLIKTLTLDVEEYKKLKQAFQGGFTHANHCYVRRTIPNVTSYDFTSSYPAVMISEMFPMSTAEKLENVTRETFEYSINNYCCLFDVTIKNLMPKYDEHYISKSKCLSYENVIENNGRIEYADEVTLTITEQDWFIICDMYDFDDDFEIGEFRRYKRGYLPREIVQCVLDLYRDKTILKGVVGKEIEYAISKGMLNSLYGMIVTDIAREIVLYDNDNGFFPDPLQSLEEQIKKYNKQKNRFLFYPWGVWVTAYARRNLFSGIQECGSDYLYADTDSVKIINPEKHKKYFDAYNESIVKKIEQVLKFYKIPIEQMKPKTKNGIEKPIGVWDFDGQYKRFKTLGAKRYMVETEKNEIILTVSGLNKYKFTEYLKVKKIENPFDFFTDDMEIEAEYSGKNVHIYFDDEQTGTLTDYTGIEHTFHEKSGMWMGQSDYKLTIGATFADYLKGIRPKR